MAELHAILAEAIVAAEQERQRWARSYTSAPMPPSAAIAGLDALAAPANRDALVAWLVEAGVLTRPIMITPDCDDHPVSDGCHVMPEAMATSDDHGMAAHDWRPLYRIGATDA